MSECIKQQLSLISFIQRFLGPPTLTTQLYLFSLDYILIFQKLNETKEKEIRIQNYCFSASEDGFWDTTVTKKIQMSKKCIVIEKKKHVYKNTLLLLDIFYSSGKCHHVHTTGG